MANNKPRVVAVEILENIEQKGAYSNLELNKIKNEGNLSSQDYALLTELVYGVIQNKRLIDYYLSPFLKKTQKLDNWVKQVLRVAVYQMVFLDNIPDYASINEAVNYGGKRGHKGIRSLVNGVLRNFQRNELKPISEIKQDKERLGIKYSVPNWMIEQFIKQFGLDTTEKILKSFNKRAKVSVRVDTDRISIEEAIEKLKESGYEVKRSELSQEGLIIENGLPIDHTLYVKGFISIQDESSMMVAPAMNLLPNHIVADVCAAPGGKTSHIASFIDHSMGGILYSSDLHEHKVTLIEQSLKRQGLDDRVEVRQLDATMASQVYDDNSFDRILIDAPCSGIGLLRRKPDIRFAKDSEAIESLPTLQLDILNNVAPLIKPGGEMVYSTCTILESENESVINQFLETHPEFKLKKINIDNELFKHNSGELLILPHYYDSDGFYIASLVRDSN